MSKNKSFKIKLEIVLITFLPIFLATLFFTPKVIDYFITHSHYSYSIKSQNNFELVNAINNIASQNLSQKEIDDLLYMLEEEKLAYNAYISLFNIWEEKEFLDISQNESVHIDTVEALFKKYGISDLVKNHKVGTYLREDFKQMFEIAKKNGSESLNSAYIEMAKLEDGDINDLQIRVLNTDNKDILILYKFLLETSKNHLRSLSYILKLKGISYSSIAISDAQYQEIISQPIKKLDIVTFVDN